VRIRGRPDYSDSRSWTETSLSRRRFLAHYTGCVNARLYLVEIGRALEHVGLEAVLIGNAAAALQGAPVTTVDFDFLFQKTPRNLRKMKALARVLGATV